MTFTLWFLIAGGLLLFMALAGSVLKRLPLSTAMVYLAVGLGLGPLGLGLLDLDIVRDAALIERVAEVAVLISLFSAGLKLRSPLSEGRWRLPGRTETSWMAVRRRRVMAVVVLCVEEVNRRLSEDFC